MSEIVTFAESLIPMASPEFRSRAGQSIINSRVGSVQSLVHDMFLIVGLHAVKSDTWVTRVILYEEFKEI